ncbi:Phosphopantothenoylcysteine decarboxylase [Fasciola gigantica]|uniref:Phosphopantothenoylcysteine decarboxylase n=1 Tax=Fasciola gigantica TaxID=46835 RepID=A0A504YHU2_FASGI|nr:Phosphopantothenoylcysteine decarboxylase [Fasciola gigantica]TPP60733.1 Phosphopantothenoylcysteine decarboxylase [Fasciola gigantica]
MDGEDIHKDNVLLGVTGSVASIKTAELVNLLEGANYSVRVMCTENAIRFFNPTELPVPVFRDADEWSSWEKRGDPVMHIELCKWANVLLLAPLSANTMAKIIAGLADNLITSVCRAWHYPARGNKRAFFAPAMNTAMWEHPITEDQVAKLTRTHGWIMIPPVEKTLMCGVYGMGAMAEPSTIVQRLRSTSATVQKIREER